MYDCTGVTLTQTARGLSVAPVLPVQTKDLVDFTYNAVNRAFYALYNEGSGVPTTLVEIPYAVAFGAMFTRYKQTNWLHSISRLQYNVVQISGLDVNTYDKIYFGLVPLTVNACVNYTLDRLIVLTPENINGYQPLEVCNPMPFLGNGPILVNTNIISNQCN